MIYLSHLHHLPCAREHDRRPITVTPYKTPHTPPPNTTFVSYFLSNFLAVSYWPLYLDHAAHLRKITQNLGVNMGNVFEII